MNLSFCKIGQFAVAIDSEPGVKSSDRAGSACRMIAPKPAVRHLPAQGLKYCGVSVD
jgi:hypothetical protein